MQCVILQVCSVNGQIVRAANQLATNGVVHVISGVIPPATGDLLHLIKTTPELSILYEALQLIGLEGLFTDGNCFKSIQVPVV